MSTILYYSTFCKNCNSLLQEISKSNVKDDMHFICIDKRRKGNDGANYVILQTGQEVLLPPTVTKVPALLLLNRGHNVLFGEEIKRHIMPGIKLQQQAAVIENGEPMAFSLGSFGGGYGISSDSYSFFDQSSDELSAKGNGGMRQQHHYADVAWSDQIETPPDNYSPDKIGSVSMEQLQQQRANDVHIERR